MLTSDMMKLRWVLKHGNRRAQTPGLSLWIIAAHSKQRQMTATVSEMRMSTRFSQHPLCEHTAILGGLPPRRRPTAG
jgi:hypothetical protein